jgi:hypothetical protein
VIDRTERKDVWRIAGVVGLAVLSTQADAAIVRGRLLHGESAAAGVSVTLLSKANGSVAPAVLTAADGMYYLYNVTPGAYSLEVWTGGTAGTPTRYPVNVTEPVTDVPAITLP